MRDTQSEFESNGRKRFLFILLLPMIIVFFVMQSMTVLGQDELPKGDGSPVQINAVKTSNSGEVTPGTKVGYTIVISNSGGIEETGMVMTDTLPVEFDIVDGTLTGKDGIVYNKRMGLCLETQHFPDSPNQLEFPSVILNPSEEFNSKTVYQFSVQ